MKPKKKATKRVSKRTAATATGEKRSVKGASKKAVAPAKAAAKPSPATGETTGVQAKATRKRAVRRAPVTEAAIAPAAVGAEIAPVEVPPILLEGDRPAPPAVSGPGRRYEVSAGTPPVPGGEGEVDLPEAYGTKELFLLPRDPHGLFVYWDFTRAQLAQYNQRAREGHLTLRIYRQARSGQPHVEVALPPEGRQWFVHVAEAGAAYVAELGYYRKRDGAWVSLSASEPAVTPPEPLPESEPVRFMAVPPEVPLARVEAKVVARLTGEKPAVARAVAEARRRGEPVLPVALAVAGPSWSAAQQAVMESWVRAEEARQARGGLVRSVRMGAPGRGRLADLARWDRLVGDAAGGCGGVESDGAGCGRTARGFWFNVHAELIVYGATEPDARVTLDGRPVALRPDGSFSCRFVLPDGRYALEAVATKADGSESRTAVLHFSRRTDYTGEVRQAPSDPALATAAARSAAEPLAAAGETFRSRGCEVNPYGRLLASLLRLLALGMIFLAGLALFLDYLQQRTGSGEGDPHRRLVSGLVLILGVVLLVGSGSWARRLTRHWDE
ncbi:MAG: hypothetical protein KatS3mg132_389 [Limisphaera sp.]|nr:MAG: hypothetical protein KatS3mg132_389 [Limisphaera sp.]